MKIAYKNIAVDYTYNPEDFNGMAYVDFNMKDLKRFLEENDGAQFTKELAYELECLDEENEAETHQIIDTDLCVYIFNWMLFECPNDLFFFDYYGESPFWLFHDLSHAENDITAGEFYVNEYIEEQRIFDGLELLKQYDMMSEFKPNMFESIVTDFRTRWNHEIDTKRIRKIMGWKKRDFFELLELYHYN